jgi:hypothetical protein
MSLTQNQMRSLAGWGCEPAGIMPIPDGVHDVSTADGSDVRHLWGWRGLGTTGGIVTLVRWWRWALQHRETP